MINRRLFRTHGKWPPEYKREREAYWIPFLGGLITGALIVLGMWWGL